MEAREKAGILRKTPVQRLRVTAFSYPRAFCAQKKHTQKQRIGHLNSLTLR